MYVPSTREIIYPYDVVLGESFSSTLAYTSRTYSEAMAMHPSFSYIPCDASSKEQTGDMITFAQFKEGYLLSEAREDAESDNEINDDSIMPPLLTLEEIDALDSGDDSDDEPMSTEMLEDIRDGNQYHPNVNRIESRYKIRYRIKQIQSEWK